MSMHKALIAATALIIQSAAGEPLLAENSSQAVSYLEDVFVFQNFYHDDDAGRSDQCGGAGIQRVPIGSFSEYIRFNTDTGYGGCRLSYAIVDPTGAASDIDIWVTFENINSTCENTGTYKIPIIKEEGLSSTPEFRFDTDYRYESCKLTFDVRSPNTYFDIEFWYDDSKFDFQCTNVTSRNSYLTASLGVPISIMVSTDNYPGGCHYKFRLRKNG